MEEKETTPPYEHTNIAEAVMERLEAEQIAEKLDMDDYDTMSAKDLKHAIVKKVIPDSVKLDSAMEIEVAYKIAKDAIFRRKPISSQYEAIRKDSMQNKPVAASSSAAAQAKMNQSIYGGVN